MKLGPDKAVCVFGLGKSGRAAVEWLHSVGASVTAVDTAKTPELLAWAKQSSSEIDCRLGYQTALSEHFDLVVVSPGVPFDQPQVASLRARGIPVWSELELGWRATQCPVVAITGTNGKTTTTEWVASLLDQAGQTVFSAGNIGRPLCEVVTQTKELDAIVLEVSSFQLQDIDAFHPSVGVLLNLAEDHLDRHASMTEYVRAKARIFQNQQLVDWAIIQLDAWEQLQSLGITVSAQVVTFSATRNDADVYLDGGEVKSRLPNDAGSLLDLAQCAFEGSHNAENIMATWLTGRAMQLMREEMVPVLKSFQSGLHRCELVNEWRGVRFYNDSKATNVHAMESALDSMPSTSSERNVWLIAGGQGKGVDFKRAVPSVRRRVKGAWLIGESASEMEQIWGPFAPCNLANHLLEAVAEAGRNAAPGDVVLLSPACASFDMFDSYKHRGDQFRSAVADWIESRQGE